jgi:Pyridoxamine 5'-phosphate oxidase
MCVVMTAAEREEFLAGVHVGVLGAAVGTAGRTLAVPVWYSYQPGGLLTGRRSRKAAAIRAADRFSVCAQDDSPPYRYVSVEGPVVSEEELDPAGRLAMARRYLGTAAGDRYVTGNPDPEGENTEGSGCARSAGSVRIRARDELQASAACVRIPRDAPLASAAMRPPMSGRPACHVMSRCIARRGRALPGEALRIADCACLGCRHCSGGSACRLPALCAGSPVALPRSPGDLRRDAVGWIR